MWTPDLPRQRLPLFDSLRGSCEREQVITRLDVDGRLRCLSDIAPHAALWVNRWGEPLADKGIRVQIEFHTEQAFGAPLWPHLFRDCAATELVNVAPEEIGIAPDLLGHASLEPTQKHYIQATGLKGDQVETRSLLAAAVRPPREGS